jgi:hypothetical protein
MQKVLILSRSDDEHVDRLIPELDALGQLWVRFDPGDFPDAVELTFQLGTATNIERLMLPDGELLFLEDVGSVWYRRPTPLRANESLPALQRTFMEREARAGLWGQLRTIEAIWVNHPSAISEATYKPHQLAMAQRVGLRIPKTLITNNPSEFQRFYRECRGNVIYKLLGFPYYEVEDGAAASTYTSLVPEEMLKEAHRIKASAHLFQEYQQKICDIRVIIIGESVFAVEIYPLSEQARIDFRQDYGALRYAVHQLPEGVQQALLALTRRYRLLYAAIDLVYTLEKQHIFLELNAVGQLGWLEQPTGLPLFHTLARFLARKT